MKYGRSGGSDPEAGHASDKVPLSDYSSGKAKKTSLDTKLTGFSRLDDGRLSDINMVTANITRSPSDQPAVPPQGILMKHSLEQHADRTERA